MLDPEEARADLRTWFDAQPDPAAAATALLDELLGYPRNPGDVLLGLDHAGEVLGTHALTAAGPHRTGPYRPLVLTWLVSRGAVDPAEIDPAELHHGMITVAATMTDVDGPAGALEFVADADRGQVLAMFEDIWRLDHPRLAELLETLGQHLPDKELAKAARRCLMRHRSHLAR